MPTHASQHQSSSAQQAVDAAARLAESALAVGHRALGRAELHVHAWRAGRDASTAAWVDEVQRQGADGTLADHAADPDLLRKYISEDSAAS